MNYKTKTNNLSLIFYENPIARCYLNCFLDCQIKYIPIIYLGKRSNFEFFKKYKFYQNNYYPLYFLKNPSIRYFIDEVENFFQLRKNFFKDSYNYENLKQFENFSFINSNSINSIQSINYFNKDKNTNYLISYQEILKNVFESNKNFYHIHPGYLPKIRGADGSLHSIANYNELGASFFKLVKKIDDGPLIYRKLLKFNKFNLNKLSNYNNSDLYRLWFSFVDPALRCSILNDYLNNKFTLEDRVNINPKDISNYYSFMNVDELSKVFRKIFISICK